MIYSKDQQASQKQMTDEELQIMENARLAMVAERRRKLRSTVPTFVNYGISPVYSDTKPSLIWRLIEKLPFGGKEL